MKKKSVAEILQGIRETFLYENNRDYNSYKFNCKFAFIPFLLFRRNQKQESNFQQVGGQAKRNISFLFIVSRALLQKYAEFNRLL